ncbi:glycoside hydrolase family 92 protein, partial [Bacteroidota bacterium]
PISHKSHRKMVVADAYLKGLPGIDYEKGFEAMVKNAEIPPTGNQQKYGRGGVDQYIKLGYVPTEYEPKNGSPGLRTHNLYPRSGTRTVEYAANDWAIALVAKGMGKTEEYIKYKTRASNWANLWNRNATSGDISGFIWPKTKAGKWVEKFSPFKFGSWNNCFYECNSWEYSFYVPHDVKSLIDSCGGNEKFLHRLNTLFANDYYTVSNEPSFLTPCLYTYAGRQDKTNLTVRNIIKHNYTAKADGIPGNDDAGSMAAWVIFHLMGFYPNAGQDVYLITSPHFKEVTLKLNANKELRILSHNLSDENIYIKEVKLGGKSLNRAWFRHNEIAEGGTLEFFMTNEPTNSWAQILPPSISDYD